MNKSVFFSAIDVCPVYISVFAQEAELASMYTGKGWYMDLSMGANQSELSGSAIDLMQSVVTRHGDGTLEMSSLTGFEAGIHEKKTIGNNFYLKSGINFIQRGSALENTGYVMKPTYQSNFLAIPLMLGLTTSSYSKENKFALFFDIGFAYLININDQSSTWAEDTYSVTDFVFETGADYHITKKLTLSLRYKKMNDLSRVYSFHYTGGEDYDYYYKTKSLILSLRLKLPVTKEVIE